jgi:SAM-dependent methyltransferase
MLRQSPLSPARMYELAYYFKRPPDNRFLRFLTALVIQHAPGRRLLDCACGTGEPALHLATEFSLTLADASPAMLRLAKRKAAAMGILNLRFHTARWVDLAEAVGGSFDAVICCGNAISQSLRPTDLRAALAGMSSVLITGGLVYVDFHETDSRADSRAGFVPVDVSGPIYWGRRQLLFVICERQARGILYRQKLCYSIEGTKLRLAGSALTIYRPINRKALRDHLLTIGFHSVRFVKRPGRWPMTAVIARKGTTT